MEYEPSAFTLMRRILPRRSLVLPAERWASKTGLRSGRSSMGVKPSDWKGLESSPVDRYRFPAASKSMSPPTWQQMPRVAWTSRIFFSLAVSRVPSALRTKRERRLTPSKGANSAAVPVSGASPAGVFRGGA